MNPTQKLIAACRYVIDCLTDPERGSSAEHDTAVDHDARRALEAAIRYAEETPRVGCADAGVLPIDGAARDRLLALGREAGIQEAAAFLRRRAETWKARDRNDNARVFLAGAAELEKLLPDDEDETPAPPPQLRVLVVDDDAEMRRSMARMLRGFGWHVDQAGDPDEALAFFAELLPEDDRPGVVLSDWTMPRGGGRRMLRECPIPVVILTGDPDLVPQGARVLTKPATAEAIKTELLLAAEQGR